MMILGIITGICCGVTGGAGGVGSGSIFWGTWVVEIGGGAVVVVGMMILGIITGICCGVNGYGYGL